MLKSPARYIQGQNLLEHLPEYLKGLGDRFLFVLTAGGEKRFGAIIREAFQNTDYGIAFVISSGRCTMTEISMIAQSARSHESTAIVGVGGGSILDSAKGASRDTGLPCVMIPTVASNDSPCSTCSVVYKESGEFERCLYLEDCPKIILADTSLILKAPVKFLVAGMGDAMATYFEARCCRKSGGNNQLRSKPTMTASAMAALCWKLLKEYGVQAKKDAEEGICSHAFETVVEVNTYLSSIGFESGGLAAAHALQSGLTMIPQLKQVQHGELVAFCTLVQLVLEGASTDEMNDVLNFCLDVGLPVCLEDMGYLEMPSNLLEAVIRVCGPKSTIHNMPFPVGADGVVYAIRQAEKIGQEVKRLRSTQVG